MKKQILTTFILLTLFTLNLTSAQTEIASDNFESNSWTGGSGFLDSWYNQGDSRLVKNNYPYEGSRHLRLRRSSGYIDRAVDLSQIQTAKLSFYAKVNSFENSDFAETLISPDGNTWHTLKTFTPADSDNQYHYYEFDLTQYGLTSTFWIAFDAEMSGRDDHLYIDDIKITSNTTTPPPELPPTDIKTWHIQYNPTPTNPSPDVQYWNLDLFDINSTTMENLKSQGVFIMCYFSAGSWEDWRPDADQFPSSCLGNNNGWPGEKWLDTKCPEIKEIMKNRIDLGMSKGCDGFDPDNMDAYGNKPGIPLTQQDSIDYYNFLANYTHSKGKQIGLKNALEILPQVLTNIDWAINEQCYQYNECSTLNQVISNDKPVFHIEYGNQNKADAICPQANEAGFSTLIKNLELDEFEIACHTYLPPPLPEPPICGNGVTEIGEICDTNTQFCTINNYQGTQSCLLDCSDYNTCTTSEFCGDFIINGNEICDNNPQSCTTTQGYSGTQSCNLLCNSYNTCSSNEFCGDFITNGPEQCDAGINGSTTCNPDCTLITPPETLITSDNFESNSWSGGNGTWNFGWWHEGDSSIISTESPKEELYHLRMRKNDGYIDRQLDLSSLTNAKLSFYAKVNSFENSDFLDILVKGSGSWKVIKTFTPTDSDNQYHYYEFDLTQYGLTSGFWIALDAEMSSTDDAFYIDDIKVTTSN